MSDRSCIVGASGWICAALLLTACALAADKPAGLRTPPCLTADSKDCDVSAAEMKQARALYRQGTKLAASGRPDEALDYFQRASALVPRNIEFATAREMARQAQVYRHMERGNRLLAEEHRVEALAEFRSAAEIDPGNDFALQRMRDALGDAAPHLSPGLRRVEESTQILLQPKPGVHDFHFRGDARALYNTVVAAYGLTAEFDDSVAPRPVRFDLGKADYATAMDAAGHVTRTFVVPVDSSKVLVLADTPDNHQRFERMALQTFYLPNATTPAELNDAVNMLRSLFELQRVSASTSNFSISVRGPQTTVDAAARLLEQMQQGAPQVLLDVKVYEISRTALRTLGLDLPLQFQMFNLSSAAIAAALGGGGQDLINQLFSSGAINQANSQAIQALLAQLQNQQGSIFSTPFATFGGGMSRFAVGIPPATANLSLNQSQIRSLEHMTVRAAQNNAATLLIGTRFPILNATFSPIFNSATLSQVLGNNSFIAPFPSFNYQDLGVSLKTTPTIHRGREIGLKIELQIQALGSQSFNGVPVISNRQYSGEITVKDGEPAVVAGLMTATDQQSLRGLPGISRLPGLSQAGNHQRTADATELLVTVTPYILRPPGGGSETLLLKR